MKELIDDLFCVGGTDNLVDVFQNGMRLITLYKKWFYIISQYHSAIYTYHSMTFSYSWVQNMITSEKLT